jgi:hypothetical protein
MLALIPYLIIFHILLYISHHIIYNPFMPSKKQFLPHTLKGLFMSNSIHNIVTPSNAPSDIVEKRDAVGDTVKRQYGAVKVYAVALCSFLPEFWYDIEHSDLTDDAKPTLAEATAFRDVLRKAGHKNPSVIWTRVRAEGRAHIEGAPEKGEKGASNKRSIQLRLIEDLSSLFRACKREESLSTQQAQAMTHIASALTAMGVDLSSLVK